MRNDFRAGIDERNRPIFPPWIGAPPTEHQPPGAGAYGWKPSPASLTPDPSPASGRGEDRKSRQMRSPYPGVGSGISLASSILRDAALARGVIFATGSADDGAEFRSARAVAFQPAGGGGGVSAPPTRRISTGRSHRRSTAGSPRSRRFGAAAPAPKDAATPGTPKATGHVRQDRASRHPPHRRRPRRGLSLSLI